MNNIILSVVIANYNYGKYLDRAIESVITQRDSDLVELIICDAGSSDDSLEIIKKYADGLPPNTHRLQWKRCSTSGSRISWWCSEKDGGQSAAFNKGFSHGSGRFLTWLNADDIMMPGTVSKLLSMSIAYPNCEWFTGNFLEFRQDNKKIISAPWGPHVLPGYLQSFNSPLVIFGPTSFFGRDAYRTVGPIDESLHYSMDTDYWLRMKRAGYRQKRLNHCCWAFRMHDLSKTAQYEGRIIEERIKKKWYEELDLVNQKNGYCCSRWRRLLGIGMRVLDGSALVAAWRRMFVVGRKFEMI